jgi:hypothetical protein
MGVTITSLGGGRNVRWVNFMKLYFGQRMARRRKLRNMEIDIFVDCNWVDTQWQQYSTHLHTNNTQNDTMK